MTRRELRRLRRAFAAALCALGPCAALQACGATSKVNALADATPSAEQDGTVATGDATPQDEAAVDTGRAPSNDGDVDGPLSCGAYITVVEGGVPRDAASDADAESLCDYRFMCGIPAGVTHVGCDIVVAELDGGPSADATNLKCRLTEGQGCLADAYAPTESGSITMECIDCLSGGAGRHTAGVAAPRCASRGAAGYFSRMAHAEAASVFAFRRMQTELAREGAPRELLLATRRAARDEVRHARTMRAFAAEHAGAAPKVRVRRAAAQRSLESIARENATEGCIRETFMALVAHYQAANAPDGRMRRAFAQIAADETRHAALAWAVARWAEARLDPAARARIVRARARAAAALRASLAARPFDTADVLVGHPGAAEATALFDAMLAGLTERAGGLIPSAETAPSARRRRGTAHADRCAPGGTAA